MRRLPLYLQAFTPSLVVCPPLSLDDLLAAIPMDWREQSLGLPANSA
jgi:hypothetical protein